MSNSDDENANDRLRIKSRSSYKYSPRDQDTSRSSSPSDDGVNQLEINFRRVSVITSSTQGIGSSSADAPKKRKLKTSSLLLAGIDKEKIREEFKISEESNTTEKRSSLSSSFGFMSFSSKSSPRSDTSSPTIRPKSMQQPPPPPPPPQLSTASPKVVFQPSPPPQSTSSPKSIPPPPLTQSSPKLKIPPPPLATAGSPLLKATSVGSPTISEDTMSPGKNGRRELSRRIPPPPPPPPERDTKPTNISISSTTSDLKPVRRISATSSNLMVAARAAASRKDKMRSLDNVNV